MGDLLRPPPPRTWRERLAARWAAVSPARLATGAGVVLLLAVTTWWLLRPGQLPVEATLPRAAASSGRTTTSSLPAANPPTTVAEALVVQAAGAVARPGVYRLPGGARVADLLAAAGGPAGDADVDRVALATRLADGQRVVVPRIGEAAEPEPPAAAGAGAGASATGTPAVVDLNTASVAELDTLPGIGPATAAAIVAYRDRHGPFRSVDDLAEVPGIGPAKLAAVRDLVRT